jgi:hypothetical protein
MNIQKENTIALGPTQLRASPMGVGTKGVKDLGQALQNVGALGWRLSEEEVSALEAAAP